MLLLVKSTLTLYYIVAHCKNLFFGHLGPRYLFLTTQKVISGQKYFRNSQNLKKNDFFEKKIISSICPHWQKCLNLKIHFLKNGSSNIAEILHAIRPYFWLTAYKVSLE